MSGLRPVLQDPGLVQVIGLVDVIAEDHLRLAVHTRFGSVVYVFMLGCYTGTAGELIQAFGHLSEGVIQLESWHLLQPEPAPPGFEPKVEVESNAPPARLHNAWVRYQPTPFFAEVGQLVEWRPQAIAMARGRVVEAATLDAPGLIVIDGHPYPFIDRRMPHLKERLSSAAMLNREVMGSFGANFTSRDPDNQSLKPTLQLLNLRTNIQDQGAIQVIGQVEAIHEDRVRFVIHHERAFYYTSMRGRYAGEVGDPVQALGRLVAGEIHLERSHVLQLEPPIGAQDEPA
jgi:hypothetical protein